MSTRVIKRTRDPLENLERMLQKTTLTTKRVTHYHIMDVGNKLMKLSQCDEIEDREKAVEEAVAAAEARAARELRSALKKLRQEKNEEKQSALDKQKLFFERHAQWVAKLRDEAEEERKAELTKKLNKAKEEALRQQWEESQRLKEEAIQAACAALRKQLRDEVAMEKERAVAEALRLAREGFKRREQEVIAQTRKECEETARMEAERVANIHQAEVDRLNHRYDVLEHRYQKELAHKNRVENDFRALQDDYRRFMDYTEGKFHSDYLMRLRYTGMELAEKRLSTVTYDPDDVSTPEFVNLTTSQRGDL